MEVADNIGGHQHCLTTLDRLTKMAHLEFATFVLQE